MTIEQFQQREAKRNAKRRAYYAATIDQRHAVAKAWRANRKDLVKAHNARSKAKSSRELQQLREQAQAVRQQTNERLPIPETLHYLVTVTVTQVGA